LAHLYPGLPAISIDYGLMEKAQNVLVIPADIGWSDVGDWSAMSNLFPKDELGNAVWAKHLGIDTENCVIYAEEPETSCGYPRPSGFGYCGNKRGSPYPSSGPRSRGAENFGEPAEASVI